jgi:hypothetical protein
MEIIGRNLPGLQNVITSGIDSVAAGITQIQDSAGISVAADSFSTNQMGTVGQPELFPSVSGFGEFPNALQYFQTQTQGVESRSGILQKEFLDVLQDKTFDPNSELTEIANNEIFDMLRKKTESPGPFIAVSPAPDRNAFPFGSVTYDNWYRIVGRRLEEALKLTAVPAENDSLKTGTTSKEEAFSALKNTPLQSAEVFALKDKSEYLTAAQSNISSPGYISPGTRLNEALGSLKEPSITGTASQNGTISDAMQRAPYDIKNLPEPEYIPTPLNDPDAKNPISTEKMDDLLENGFKINQDDYIPEQSEYLGAKATYTPKDPEYLEGTPPGQKSETGSANQADQKGIIIVGGKEESAAERGIIIVGGKTDGTYFGTIDDTLGALNSNPTAETVQLFQQQVGALQDLSSTVTQSVQMDQQLTSSVFAARIRL